MRIISISSADSKTFIHVPFVFSFCPLFMDESLHHVAHSPRLAMLNNSGASSDFDLTIRQQPDRARVAGGKEKGMCPCAMRATDH